MTNVLAVLAGKKILVVDDEVALRESIREDLQSLEAEVFEAANGRIAYDMVGKIQPDVIISDLRMPGGDGIELLQRVRASRMQPEPLAFLITGFADLTLEQAKAVGAQGVLVKPFNLAQLRDLVAGSFS